MATMALPIRELERSVCVDAEKARAETERVATYSGSRRADAGTALKVMCATLGLKWLLSGLVRSQDKLLSVYRGYDFNRCSPEQLTEVATSLGRIVNKERDILARANTLGAEIRVWWDTSLRRLAEQVDHLDSIAESLHLAADPDGTQLLALAAEQFAMK